MSILEKVKLAAAKRVLYLPHAVKQMTLPERLISPEDVELVLKNPLLVEDYSEDPRGHSCLILGFPHTRAVHVVCSPKEAYLAVITAYLPSPADWDKEFRRRLKK